MQSIFGAGFALIFERSIEYAERLKNNNITLTTFIYVIVFLFLYIIVFTVFNFLRRYFRSSVIVAIDKQVKLDYLNLLLVLDTQEYSKKDTGHYLSRFTNDLPTLINDYILEFFNLLLYIFQSIFTIIVAFYINWIIAVIFLVLSFIIIIYTTFFESKFKSIRSEISKANSKYVTELKSLLQGFDEIKTNKAEKAFVDKYIDSVGKTLQLKREWWNLEAIYSPGNAFLTLLLTYASIVLSCIFYAYGYFSIGLLTAAIYLSSQIYNPISNIFEQLAYIRANKALSIEVYKDFDKNARCQNKKVEFVNNIHLDKVSFKYNGERDYIFKNISFDIVKGKKYLIIGESGIGKSTLLRILTGKLEYEGSITFDEFNLKEIQYDSLYGLISYVSQTPYLFNDTIRNNIDLANLYQDSDVISSIKEVSLENFVLSKGLNSIVAEEVFEVSGGEKQRICLARAILKKPAILLLDEVTASLDLKTTYEIEKLILSFQGKTILYICHKASKALIESFDYIISFDNGKNIKVLEASEYE